MPNIKSNRLGLQKRQQLRDNKMSGMSRRFRDRLELETKPLKKGK